MTKKTLIYDIETVGLNSCTDRIICISCSMIGEQEIFSFYGIDEKQIIHDFWKHLRDKEISLLVGFNNESFDFPFLVKRSIILEEKIIKKIQQIDLRKTVNSFYTSYNKYEKGDLGFWAKILSVDVQTTDGGTMPILFLEGKYEEIKNHCCEDVKIEKLLFERCRKIEVIS